MNINSYDSMQIYLHAANATGGQLKKLTDTERDIVQYALENIQMGILSKIATDDNINVKAILQKLATPGGEHKPSPRYLQLWKGIKNLFLRIGTRELKHEISKTSATFKRVKLLEKDIDALKSNLTQLKENSGNTSVLVEIRDILKQLVRHPENYYIAQTQFEDLNQDEKIPKELMPSINILLHMIYTIDQDPEAAHPNKKLPIIQKAATLILVKNREQLHAAHDIYEPIKRLQRRLAMKEEELNRLAILQAIHSELLEDIIEGARTRSINELQTHVVLKPIPPPIRPLTDRERHTFGAAIRHAVGFLLPHYSAAQEAIPKPQKESGVTRALKSRVAELVEHFGS